MSFALPADWADSFDPQAYGWEVFHGQYETKFPEVKGRGWEGGLKQRDFWVSGACRLIVEWSRPWSEIITVFRDGTEYPPPYNVRHDFDSLWR